jgi:hypothetical protein
VGFASVDQSDRSQLGIDELLVASCRTEDSRLLQPCDSEWPLHRRGQIYSVVINQWASGGAFAMERRRS